MKGIENYDLILSMVIFISAYASVFYLTPHFVQTYREVPDIHQNEATYLMKKLTETPGTPYNWTNASQATQIGLALWQVSTISGVLDPQKAAAINNTNCTELARKTGLTNTNILIKVSWDGQETACANQTTPITPRHVKRPVAVGSAHGQIEVLLW